LVVFLLFEAALLALGAWYYAAQRAQIRMDSVSQLRSTARLKVGQIVAWREERLRTAATLQDDPLLCSSVALLARGQLAPEGRRALWGMLDALRRHGGYESALVLDTKRRVLVASPSRDASVGPFGAATAARALRTRQIILSDLHVRAGSDIHLDLHIPLFAPSASGAAVGSVLLRIDPRGILYPLIQSWPVPSRTGETLLVRREGDRVLFLNELRFRHGTALRLSIPLARGGLPAARAVLGELAPIEGVDYRGVRVLAQTEPVPGSPWRLVSKLDESEVYGSLPNRALAMALLLAVLTLAAGAMVWQSWRRRALEMEAQRLEAELRRRLAERRYGHLIGQANDIVLVMDEAWRVVEANDRAVEAYGYPADELIGLPAQMLAGTPGNAGFDGLLEQVRAEGMVRREDMHRRKDGSVFPVELSVRRAAEDGQVSYLAVVRDVSERHQAEAQLRGSEERFRVLYEHAPLGYQSLSAEGRLLEVNQAWLDMLGYSREEVLGREFGDFMAAQDSERFRAALAQASRQEGGHGFLATLIHRDGAELQVSINCRTTLEPRDGSPRLFCILQDITESLRASEAVREAKERLSTLVDACPLPILTLGQHGVVTGWSRAATRVLGWREDEVIGRVPRTLPPDFEEGFNQLVLRVRRGEELTGLEVPQVRRDGTRLTVRAFAAPLWGALGEVVGAVAVLEDVTERISAEELRARLTLAVEHSTEGFVISDSDRIIRYVNRAFEELMGWSAEELVGQHTSCLDRLMLDPVVGPSLREASERGETWTRRVPMRRKDGTRFIDSITVTPILDEAGAPTYFVGVNRDITDQVSMEEQLLQSQKMEAVGRLAGGVAHDFNNLLTAILGYCHLLEDFAGVSPRLGRGLGEIRKAGERAASLTHQLLAFSRKQVLDPKVTDLNEVVAETEKLLRRLIGEDIELRAHLDPGLGRVLVDPGQVTQVLVNLAVNARDAMPGGGKLTLETQNTDVAPEQVRRHREISPGPYVMLAVSDTGIGMSEETLTHIFEPFFTTKEMGKGTGLGLATVYGIVKQSGGDVWVYSEPGRGSTFRIYLPRVSVGQEGLGHARDATPRPVGGTETILVVEDDDAVRTLASDVLASHGYQVTACPDPTQALEMLEPPNPAPHLLVTDVVMPGMDGRQLAERARQILPGLRVLYISGYTQNSIVHHGVLDEGLAFLQKPFTPEALARKVRAVLDA
jgi:PAS domain S-box-containing protein